MQYLIEISNRHKLFKLLKKLQPATLPLWGKMNAQQMVKHLITIVQYTYGTLRITEDHLGFGSMNHQEWIIWHSKHFIHHFKQFGLLSA